MIKVIIKQDGISIYMKKERTLLQNIYIYIYIKAHKLSWIQKHYLLFFYSFYHLIRINFPCGAKDVCKSQYLEIRVGVFAGLHCPLYLFCQLKRENGDWPMGVARAQEFNLQ